MGNIRDRYKVDSDKLDKDKKRMPSSDSPDFAEEMLFYSEFFDKKTENERDENDDNQR